MYLRNLALTLTVSLFAISANAQMRVMAAPGNLKMAAKQTFKLNNRLPVVDTLNIYNEMLNDESDDLMENHPAEDIYSNIWTNTGINPYRVSIKDLPDSATIDLSEFVMPIKNYRISSNFGPRRYRYHYGIDLAVPSGTEVVAAFSGKVRIVNYQARGYGHYVVLRHDNGLETVYAHLSAATVQIDQDVKAGERIGISGNTGRSTGPHLHFETRYIGNAFNPASIVNFNAQKLYAKKYTLTKQNNFGYVNNKYKSASNRRLAQYYKVRKGDNLSRIASRNKISVAKLKKINGMKSSRIRPGQRIRIK